MSGEWSEAPGASEQQVEPGGPVVDAFENAPVALMRVAGPEHRYMAANAAYRSLLGRGDLIGRTPLEVLPEFAGQQHFEVLDRVFHTGQSEEHQAWRTQVQREGAAEAVVLVLQGVRAAPVVALDLFRGQRRAAHVSVPHVVSARRPGRSPRRR